jgi:single-stranded DNA-binding protein
MSTLELNGKIKLISSTQTFDSGFSKREFVITTAEQYPQDIKLEVIKDKCSLLDKYSVGNEVKVSFNVRGNEFNEKYYVNLQAWKIEPMSGASESQPQPASASNDPIIPQADDDLPF